MIVKTNTTSKIRISKMERSAFGAQYDLIRNTFTSSDLEFLRKNLSISIDEKILNRLSDKGLIIKEKGLWRADAKVYMSNDLNELDLKKIANFFESHIANKYLLQDVELAVNGTREEYIKFRLRTYRSKILAEQVKLAYDLLKPSLAVSVQYGLYEFLK